VHSAGRYVSDLINRRLLYGISAVGTVVWTFVFFSQLEAGSALWMYIGIPIGLFFHSLMYGPQAAFVVEQFSPRLRYTGASLAYTIAGVLGGAIAPMMFTLLLDTTDSWVWVAVYLAGTCVLTMIGLLPSDATTMSRKTSTTSRHELPMPEIGAAV
jgi:MFS family permease